MNEVHHTIAAAVIIPTKEEREAQRINAHLEKLQKKKEQEVAGLFSKDRDAEIRLVVLQPFVVMGGVFSIHLEAAGNDSRSALCTSLPIVHDAVLTELHNTSEDPVMQAAFESLCGHGLAADQRYVRSNRGFHGYSGLCRCEYIQRKLPANANRLVETLRREEAVINPAVRALSNQIVAIWSERALILSATAAFAFSRVPDQGPHTMFGKDLEK